MAELERTFLGMTHNPFVQRDEGFFERGDRKAYLDQLRHLSELSRRVLLVTGPEAVGKTTLLRQLMATLEPRIKAVRINAELISTSREVFMRVVRGFGIAADSDANSQLLAALITAHVLDQEEAGRVCTALFDDAHLLEPRAVDDLLQLVQACPLRLVLFGEVRIVPAVERAAERHCVEWHEIRVGGFGEADAREYLEWRFQQARYRGRVPFTDQQVREIVRLSEGLPGRINQLANALLVKLESGDTSAGASGFPPLHKALLALIVVVFALIYILWQQSEEGPAVEKIEVPIVADETDSLEPDEALALNTAEESQPVSSPERQEDYTKTPHADVAPGVDTSPGLTSPEDIQPALRDSAQRSGIQPGNVVQTVAVDPTEVEPSDSAMEAAPVEAAPVESPVEAALEPAGISAPPSDPVVLRGGAWLMRQNPEYFTIQLLTVSSAERAVEFVSNQEDDSDEFATYRVLRDGRVLHVVVYGLFSNRAAAQSAAADLPASMGKVQPWIRPLDAIHGAIRTALQQ